MLKDILDLPVFLGFKVHKVIKDRLDRPVQEELQEQAVRLGQIVLLLDRVV